MTDIRQAAVTTGGDPVPPLVPAEPPSPRPDPTPEPAPRVIEIKITDSMPLEECLGND